MKKKQNVQNDTSIHFYYTNVRLRRPPDFVAIHQAMGWLTTTRPVSEKNTCMRHLSKCKIFATLAKYSNVRCNEVSASRACNPLEFLFSLSAVCAVHPQSLPSRFFHFPSPAPSQLGSELVTMATAAVTHARTSPPLASAVISYSFACLSCPLKENLSGLIM